MTDPITHPKTVYCYTFMRGSEFVDDALTIYKIEKNLLLGALALRYSRRLRGEVETAKAHTIIYYVRFGGVPVPNYSGLPKNFSGDAWAILFSRLEEDEEYIVFGPLMGAFDLVMHHSLHVDGFFRFIDFRNAIPLCVISPQFLYVLSEETSAGKEFVESVFDDNVSYQEIPLVSTPFRPLVPPAGESLNLNYRISFTFTLEETVEVWNTARNNFLELVNGLKGSPNRSELEKLLDANGVMLKYEDIDMYGLTKVTLIGEDFFEPCITIRRSLPEGLKLISIAHEIGHLVYHLPILVADAIKQEHGKLAEISDREVDLQHTKRIEEEADWFAAQLLVPPLIWEYMDTGGYPRDKNITRLMPTPDGDNHVVDLRTRAYRWFYELAAANVETSLRYEWKVLRNCIQQQEEQHTDSSGLPNLQASIDQLVERLTNMVVNRDDFFNDLNPHTHNAIRHSLEVIEHYRSYLNGH